VILSDLAIAETARVLTTSDSDGLANPNPNRHTEYDLGQCENTKTCRMIVNPRKKFCTQLRYIS